MGTKVTKMGGGLVLDLYEHTFEYICSHYGLLHCNTMDTNFAKEHAECSGTPSMSETLMQLNHALACQSYQRHTVHHNKIYEFIHLLVK